MFQAYVVNTIVRFIVGVTNITMGAIALADPEYTLHEILGMELPYYFDDKYDGQTYLTWNGYGDLEDEEELTPE